MEVKLDTSKNKFNLNSTKKLPKNLFNETRSITLKRIHKTCKSKIKKTETMEPLISRRSPLFQNSPQQINQFKKNNLKRFPNPKNQRITKNHITINRHT